MPSPIYELAMGRVQQPRFWGVGDTQKTAVLTKPEKVTIPVLEEIRARYLEVHEIQTGRVVTVVGLLSPRFGMAYKASKSASGLPGDSDRASSTPTNSPSNATCARLVRPPT